MRSLIVCILCSELFTRQFKYIWEVLARPLLFDFFHQRWAFPIVVIFPGNWCSWDKYFERDNPLLKLYARPKLNLVLFLNWHTYSNSKHINLNINPFGSPCNHVCLIPRLIISCVITSRRDWQSIIKKSLLWTWFVESDSVLDHK